MTATVLLWILAAGFILIGLAGTVLPLLPGTTLLFLGLALGAWIDDFAYVGLGTLGVLAGLTVLTYFIEFLSGALGARFFGAGKRAMIGAAVGAVIGLFMGIAGILIGPFIGAAIGELTAKRTLKQASYAGVGTTLGFVVGVILKLLICLVMIGIFVVARFT